MKMLTCVNSFQKKINTPSVIVIGNFDGIHLGHQELIQEAQKIAREKGDLPCHIMTFDPHPRQLFGHKEFKPMMSLREKMNVFKQMGVDGICLLHFSLKFSQLSTEDFVSQYLLPLNPVTVMVGSDFSFGYRGLGDTNTLKELGKGYFTVESVKLIHDHTTKISSSRIRDLISEGKVEKVSKLLGRCYSVHGYLKYIRKTSKSCHYYIGVQHIIPKSGNFLIRLEKDNQYIDMSAQIIDEYNLRVTSDAVNQMEFTGKCQVGITFIDVHKERLLFDGLYSIERSLV